jgi:hypothetical protein
LLSAVPSNHFKLKPPLDIPKFGNIINNSVLLIDYDPGAAKKLLLRSSLKQPTHFIEAVELKGSPFLFRGK